MCCTSSWLSLLLVCGSLTSWSSFGHVIKDEDGRSSATTVVTEFLLYSTQNSIKGQVWEPVSESFTDAINPIVSKKATFVGLDFDARNDYIYYSDVVLNTIYRVKKNGTGSQILLESNSVENIALDWISKNLYYIDSSNGTLNVIYTEMPEYRKVLLSNLGRPRGIAVHPNKGYIFFSEWDRPANISRADLDGTNVMVFRNLTLGWPNGLAIDYDTDRIYWCDALYDHVQHAKLDGTDVHTITSPSIKHPFSIVIHDDWLYVTDWRLDAIVRMNKFFPPQERTLAEVDASDRLYGIRIFSIGAQVIADHPPCNSSKQCEKFCFPTPDEDSDRLIAKCGCSNGEKLSPDGNTCMVDPEAEPTDTSCAPEKFTCSNGRCIQKNWVCDGEDNCLDNSDEDQNCTELTCSEDQFQCEESGHCISNGFKCNSDNDCGDNSDEQGCGNVTCHSSEFQCGNGLCINNTFKCDSDNDCGDNSDEQGCGNVTCHSSEFQCGNGRCIPMNWRCDSEDDCVDRSDEFYCANKTCSPFEFTCPNTGTCIPKDWVCDGNNDCNDNKDEEDCPVECQEGQFKCNDGKRCIRESYKCDGIPDCDDSSDESGCPTNEQNQCNENHQFRCEKSGMCIPKIWICDGIVDCENLSDEPHSCGKVTCLNHQFQCNNSRCIAQSRTCDGNDDCWDGSDETHCSKPPFRCGSEMWQCEGVQETCINRTKVCDGQKDCPNGADEGPGCDANDCEGEDIECPLACMQTPNGRECMCKKGEQLKVGSATECEDINECYTSAIICSQKCNNFNGSFECSCNEGYTLGVNKTSCKACNQTEAFLVISNRQSIMIADLHQSNLETVPVSVKDVVTIASDMKNDTLFWSDMKEKQIVKFEKGGSLEVLIGSGLDRVRSLAYDWITGNIYWIDSGLKALAVAKRDGSDRMILLNKNISQPRGLAVDPLTGGGRWLFWTDWEESNPRIERASLDGKTRSVIINTNILRPNGLTLDIPTKRIYFADSQLDFIDFCNYDGTGRQQVVSKSHYFRHLYSMSVFEDSVYWTNRQLNRVLSVHKLHGNNETLVSDLVSRPVSMFVHHKVLQPSEDNPCASNPCQYLCLLKYPSGYTCFCRPGYKEQDGKCN